MSEDLREKTETLLTTGQTQALFEVAKSNDPLVDEVLRAVAKQQSPSKVASSLGLDVGSEMPDAFFFTSADLNLAMSVVGDSEDWNRLVRVFNSTDPCDSGNHSRRTDVLNNLARVANNRVINFLGSLLYYDDKRPEAFEVPSDCYPTSVAAAIRIKTIFGEYDKPIPPTQIASIKIVAETKSWWESSSAEYESGGMLDNHYKEPNLTLTEKSGNVEHIGVVSPHTKKDEPANGSLSWIYWILGTVLTSIAILATLGRRKRRNG